MNTKRLTNAYAALVVQEAETLYAIVEEYTMLVNEALKVLVDIRTANEKATSPEERGISHHHWAKLMEIRRRMTLLVDVCTIDNERTPDSNLVMDAKTLARLAEGVDHV